MSTDDIDFLSSVNFKSPNIPPRLNIGDTIGICAPSSPFDHDIFNEGVSVLKDWGFHIRIPRGLYESSGYLAGSDAHRAGLIHELFTDTDVRAIICAKGGYGSMRVLPLLDYEWIRKNPKLFIGFSDASTLLWTLYKKANLMVVHGPMITTIPVSTEKTRQALRTMLISDFRMDVSPQNSWVVRQGIARGPVAGGNLCTLCHLAGTRFQPRFRHHILFIEDRGEATYRIDRMMVQLKMAGCLDGISGLIIGSFEGCGDINDIVRVMANTIEDAIPIMAGFDIGHGTDNIPIPIGLMATLDTYQKTLVFDQSSIAPS